jgi:hypothetical protein
VKTKDLTLEGLPPASDAEIAEVVLGGKTTISGRDSDEGYPVALRGKVRATVCPDQR